MNIDLCKLKGNNLVISTVNNPGHIVALNRIDTDWGSAEDIVGNLYDVKEFQYIKLTKEIIECLNTNIEFTWEYDNRGLYLDSLIINNQKIDAKPFNVLYLHTLQNLISLLQKKELKINTKLLAKIVFKK